MKKRFKRIYIEICPLCNLSCSFCPRTKRQTLLDIEKFEKISSDVKDFTDYIYFHVMGEPLLHPNLYEFFEICHKKGLKVNLVTNGTLVWENIERLKSPALRKLTISLHSFEANAQGKFESYMENCIASAKEISKFSIVELRLWNKNSSHENLNEEITTLLEKAFSTTVDRGKEKIKLADNVFLGFAEEFEWPSLENKYFCEKGSCLGLIDQVAILSNGDVVPCCLDSAGEIVLGNIFAKTLGEILSGERAEAILQGFRKEKKIEQLCKHCSFRK